MTQLGLTVPILQTKMEKFSQFAQLAEEARFDSVWGIEQYRNPFVVHALTASTTSRIKLATGIAQAFSRSPFEMANAAADVDEISGGRTILGIGPGGDDWLKSFHSTNGDRALSRMSEYIDVMRMSWEYHAKGAPGSLQYHGRHYTFEGMAGNPWGARKLIRPTIPIYIAAMRPKMIHMAATKAEGIVSYSHTPEFAAAKVRPVIAKAAMAAGRDPQDVDYACLTVCSVTNDRVEAMRRARIQVGIYVAVDITDPVIQFHGYQKEQMALREAISSRGYESLADVTPDYLVQHFAIAGTPDEARASLRRFHESIPHVVLHPPYAAVLSAEESEDAFRNIVATFGDQQHR
jgi:alkanesulfonate monooxygenase SsuD/methylene tetrahydromethanopterin reductase-like flavin-dependent oxidoreductase (luciferase family)